MDFENKGVNNIEVINNKNVEFEHDSCKEAWEHYKIVYFNTDGNGDIQGEYKLNDINQQLVMSNYKAGKYFNQPTAKWPYKNRYYLLQNAKSYLINVEYPGENSNLSGDCDFNFNNKKYDFFKKLLENDYNDYPRILKYAMSLLDECSKTHHTLVNFSLMQTKGNMQGFKGSCLNNGVYAALDRADSLVAYLYSYYKLNDSQKDDSYILKNANKNANTLKEYLKLFSDVYDYCKKVYFIDDIDFVNRIISEGCKHIKNGSDVIRYMRLAIEFWDRKELKIKEIYKQVNVAEIKEKS